ncbi:MAG: BMP family ABC transporter substrate-binding protein [Actinobacteria bacterium]|nr:BMP family ABC transporter substrate-binding protein [Actinomycetota bacterium]
MAPTRQLVKVMAVVVVLAVLSTACAGSKGAEPTTNTVETASTAASTAETVSTTAPSTATTDGNQPATAKTRVLLLTENPIGDSAYFGSGKRGLERAAADFGIETGIIEAASDPTSRSDALRGAVLEDWDLIVLMSFAFNDSLTEVAPEHPDLQFICVDCTVDAPNVLNLDFRTQEAAYLEGLIAGRLTETNIIGSVLAIDIPYLHRWVDPYYNGALEVNPDLTPLDPLVVGSFDDPVTAKELALTVAGQGADIVNGLAATGNVGVFEAAQEADFLSFGVDVNQCGEAPGHIIENVVKRVDEVVYRSIESFLNGEKLGTFASFGLAENGVGLSQFIEDGPTGCVFADHPELFDEILAAQQAIIDGSIVIPDPAAG